MSKRVNIHPNERLDIYDTEHGFNGFTEDETYEETNQRLSYTSQVLSGFQVRIDDPTTRLVTVINGYGFNANGEVLYETSNPATSREIQLPNVPGPTNYLLMVTFVKNESDVDARAHWDPTANANVGAEYSQNVTVKQTPDWKIVTPIPTGSTFPNDPAIIPLAVITVTGGVISSPTGTAKQIPVSVVESVNVTSQTVKFFDTRTFPSSGTITFVHQDGSPSYSLAYNSIDHYARTIHITTAFTTTPNVGGTYISDGVNTPSDIGRITSTTTNIIARSAMSAPRFWIPNKNRGRNLRIFPHPTSINNMPDYENVHTFRDYVDASAVDIEAAKCATVTIGNGINTFGDFNGTNEAPFIQALNILNTTGGRLYVKEGTYIFTSGITITCTAGLIIEGCSPLKASIVGAANITPITYSLASNVYIKNITITTAGSGSACNCITLTGAITGTTIFHIDSCILNGYSTHANSTAIYATTASSYGKVSNCNISVKKRGIVADTNTFEIDIFNNSFTVTGSATSLIELTGSGGYSAHNNYLTSLIGTLADGIVVSGTTYNSKIVDNLIECSSVTGSHIRMSGVDGIITGNNLINISANGITITTSNVICSENNLSLVSGASTGINCSTECNISNNIVTGVPASCTAISLNSKCICSNNYIEFSSADANTFAIVATSDCCVIGNKIVGIGKTFGTGIYSGINFSLFSLTTITSKNYQISDNSFYNLQYGLKFYVSGAARDDVLTGTFKNVSISNNIFDTLAYGMYSSGSVYVHISPYARLLDFESLLISDNQASNVDRGFYAGPYCIFNSISFESNKWTGTGTTYSAINIPITRNMAGFYIVGNNFSNFGDTVAFDIDPSAIMSDCNFGQNAFSSGNSGIVFTNTGIFRDAVITDNIYRDLAYFGIYASDSDLYNTQIVNNSFRTVGQTWDASVRLNKLTACSICENIFDNCGPDTIKDGSTVWVTTSMLDTIIKNNTFITSRAVTSVPGFKNDILVALAERSSIDNNLFRTDYSSEIEKSLIHVTGNTSSLTVSNNLLHIKTKTLPSISLEGTNTKLFCSDNSITQTYGDNVTTNPPRGIYIGTLGIGSEVINNSVLMSGVTANIGVAGYEAVYIGACTGGSAYTSSFKNNHAVPYTTNGFANPAPGLLYVSGNLMGYL